MSVRIATYNVNNLFERANVLQLEGFSAEAAEVLNDVRQLSAALESASYAGAVGTKIRAILKKYGFHTPGTRKKWFKINEVRERLFKTRRDGSGVDLIAKGRADWFGWVELVRDTVHAASTENTGRVIKELKADVMCVVEVEDRLTLDRFNSSILKSLGGSFRHNLLVDGNDDRGIDVGILSQFEIGSVRSHIDDRPPGGGNKPPIFSRDCPEYEVLLPSGKTLWLLCNHLKSKGFGTPASNNARRLAQAKRVREILGRFDLARDFVVVAGDLNDTPDSAPLQPLVSTPNLFDVLASPLLGGPRWTFQTANEQIDYLLVSKPLNSRLKKVAIERRGIFNHNNFGGLFPHLPEVTSRVTQASDHAAVSAEFDI